MSPRCAALAAVMLLPPAALAAQAPKSQHATVTQILGTTQVMIVYNRPNARGRTLFGSGGVVP
jgi:dihydrodipicolinate synthase/N-acetylneuraminate lyase